SYQPPTVEYYWFDINDIASKEEAETTAKEVREATGERAEVTYGDKADTWRVRIGERKETVEEANAFKEFLTDKGFAEADMTTEKVTLPSEDAVALTQQLKTGASNTRVRSLMSAKSSSGPNTAPANASSGVKNTVMTGAVPPPVDPNLREVVV